MESYVWRRQFAGIYVVLSCVVVIAGIIMMFFSPDTVKSAALMAGVIFVISGVIDSIMLYRIHKISKNFVGEIKDIVDEIDDIR